MTGPWDDPARRELKARLKRLYRSQSRHASYQNVPVFVREALGYNETIDEDWRGDTARFTFLRTYLEVKPGLNLGDVGANTGFFVLSLAERHPDANFVAFEPNPDFAEFIRLICSSFGLANVAVHETLVELGTIGTIPALDVMLHFNVLHHAGHDFDADRVACVEDWRDYAVAYLEGLRQRVSRLVLQVGANWGGNKATPLLTSPDDTKRVVSLAGLVLQAGWEPEVVALPTRNEAGAIEYRPLPRDAVLDATRDEGITAWSTLRRHVERLGLADFRGEFYRRPIFVAKAAS